MQILAIAKSSLQLALLQNCTCNIKNTKFPPIPATILHPCDSSQLSSKVQIPRSPMSGRNDKGSPGINQDPAKPAWASVGWSHPTQRRWQCLNPRAVSLIPSRPEKPYWSLARLRFLCFCSHQLHRCFDPHPSSRASTWRFSSYCK